MRKTHLLRTGSALLVPAMLLVTAGCDNRGPVADPQASSAGAEPEAPVAAESDQAPTPSGKEDSRPTADPVVPPPRTRAPVAPAPAVRKKASAAPAEQPAPAPPPPAPADPHAGHDMSNMSDEDMKHMGHD